jgi:hypothetical protein
MLVSFLSILDIQSTISIVSQEATRRTRSSRAQLRLFGVAAEVAEAEAAAAGALGFQARAVVLATLPYSDPKRGEFSRTNGGYRLTLLAPREVGLPYGRYPRLLLAWLATEAVRTGSPRLHLGPSLTGFLGELGLVPTGGRHGTIPRLLDQMRRLFVCTFHCSYEARRGGETFARDRKFSIADASDLVLRQQPGAAAWRSDVVLNPIFFRELLDAPVPIDLRVLRALRSPLAIDIYCWLTHRFSYLTRSTEVPWEALHVQFGIQRQRLCDFRKDFLAKLRPVLRLYPAARVRRTPAGLELRPSRPSIRKLP